MMFNSAVRLSGNTNALDLRWTALSSAVKYLTTASKIYGADNVVKIHIARGDCEVGRFQLGEDGFKAAFDNREVLLRNAVKFYAGAKNLAPTHAIQDEVSFRSSSVFGYFQEIALVDANVNCDRVSKLWSSNTSLKAYWATASR